MDHVFASAGALAARVLQGQGPKGVQGLEQSHGQLPPEAMGPEGAPSSVAAR